MYSCGDIPDKPTKHRKLKPYEKLEAVERIRNGETKAAVARSLNVSQTTMGNWFRNAERIQFHAYMEMFKQRSPSNSSNSPTLPGNVVNSPNITIPFNDCLSRPRPRPSSVESSQSMSPPYKPWKATHTASSMNKHGNNQLVSSTLYCMNPSYSPSMATQSHSPESVPRMVSPETKGEPMLGIHDDESVIDKLGMNSSTSNSASCEPLDLRLPAARTTHKDNNNSVASTVSVNGEERDNVIDSIDALRNAEMFHEWFKTYSDPTLTRQDFTEFEDLLRRVKEITQRPASNPVQRVIRRK